MGDVCQPTQQPTGEQRGPARGGFTGRPGTQHSGVRWLCLRPEKLISLIQKKKKKISAGLPPRLTGGPGLQAEGVCVCGGERPPASQPPPPSSPRALRPRPLRGAGPCRAGPVGAEPARHPGAAAGGSPVGGRWWRRGPRCSPRRSAGRRGRKAGVRRRHGSGAERGGREPLGRA